MRQNLAGRLEARFQSSLVPAPTEFTAPRSIISETMLSMRLTGLMGSRMTLHFAKPQNVRTISGERLKARSSKTGPSSSFHMRAYGLGYRKLH
jgi:hypothetical protein